MTAVAELATSLVRIPSINPPPDASSPGEQRAADLVAGRCRRAGLAVTRVPVPGHADTLIVRVPGLGAAPARLFTGHLDVVPVADAERDRWASDPFSGEVRDGRLWGRGASDMKGGVAALVTAACELSEQGRTPAGDTLLVLTTDEEDLMSGSKAVAGHPLLDVAADVVVCEPTSLRPCTVGRGRTWARVTLRGQTGHGSRPSAPNAIESAMELLGQVAAEDFTDAADIDHGLSFWRPLAIEAGVEPCVVPDRCTLTLDARLVPDHAPDDVWVRLARVADRVRAAHGITIDVDVIDRREGWRTPPTAPLIRETLAALAAEGVPGPRPHDLCFTGTTDGTVLRRPGANHGVRDVVIVGPGDLALAHRENESVEITELEAARRVYRRLMMRDAG